MREVRNLVCCFFFSPEHSSETNEFRIHASAFVVCVIYCWGKCQGLWTDFSFVVYRTKVKLSLFLKQRQHHYTNFAGKETEYVLKKLLSSLQMNSLNCQNGIFFTILTSEVVYLH